MGYAAGLTEGTAFHVNHAESKLTTTFVSSKKRILTIKPGPIQCGVARRLASRQMTVRTPAGAGVG